MIKPEWMRQTILRWRASRELADWEAGRSSSPPHFIKQQLLRDRARRHGLPVFLETGTCYGDMIAALRGAFEHLYSIELSPVLAQRCQRRFRHNPDVTILAGDSARVLPTLLPTIRAPILFWLDGHYSGGVTARGSADTPIIAELAAIQSRGNPLDVILIDDARCFGRDPGYPTVDQIAARVHPRRVRVSDDIIEIL